MNLRPLYQGAEIWGLASGDTLCRSPKRLVVSPSERVVFFSLVLPYFNPQSHHKPVVLTSYHVYAYQNSNLQQCLWRKMFLLVNALIKDCNWHKMSQDLSLQPFLML